MKDEMRQRLAREPFAEKIRKVALLIRLAKTFPRRSQSRLRPLAIRIASACTPLASDTRSLASTIRCRWFDCTENW